MTHRQHFEQTEEYFAIPESSKKAWNELIKRTENKRFFASPLDIIHSAMMAEYSDFLDIDAATKTLYKDPMSVVKKYPDAKAFPLHVDPDNPPFLRDALTQRKSCRSYLKKPINYMHLSHLLQYSYGIKHVTPAYNQHEFPVRYSPSSGGLQSNNLYVAVFDVDGLTPGIYYYDPTTNSCLLIEEGLFRKKITLACGQQGFISDAGAILILTCSMDRLLWKYGIRAYRYAHLDSGFLGQSLYLLATQIKLGICAVAGFIDHDINQLLRIDGREEFTSLLFTLGVPMGKAEELIL